MLIASARLRGAMFLFDTDIVSNVLKPRPSARLLSRLASLASERQCISAVTLAELTYGAARSEQPDRLRRLISEEILPRVTVLDFGRLVAFQAGELRAALEKAGGPLAWPDIQIAATALAHDCTLVTGNERHFARVPGLRVENWL